MKIALADAVARSYPKHVAFVGSVHPFLDQIRFDLIGDQQQRLFADSRQARFGQLAVVLDAQLEGEVVLPDRGGAIRLRPVKAGL